MTTNINFKFLLKKKRHIFIEYKKLTFLFQFIICASSVGHANRGRVGGQTMPFLENGLDTIRARGQIFEAALSATAGPAFFQN